MAKFRGISGSMLKFLKKMNRCKVKCNDLIPNWSKIHVTRPYQTDGSFYFLRAVKHNCLTKVKGMIEKYGRFFVLEFDHIGRTALHIACSIGHKELINLLLDQGSDVDAEDFLGRTSLYYAVNANQRTAVVMLLKNKCNPFSKTVCYRKLSKDEDIVQLICLAQKVEIYLFSLDRSTQ
jgi:ankyrin repeat protein